MTCEFNQERYTKCMCILLSSTMHAALFYSSTKKGALDSQPQVEKVCQLLALGRWFSPGTPASSTTKTGRHDIAEILLKVALKHQQSNQIKFTQVMKLIQA